MQVLWLRQIKSEKGRHNTLGLLVNWDISTLDNPINHHSPPFQSYAKESNFRFSIIMGSEPTRVAIYATVTDIAGCPQRRHVQISQQFCKYINRKFHPDLDPTLYDHVHIPADFDTPEPLRRWFILDLNVTRALDNEEVRKLPHQVYLATRRGDKL